MPAPDAFVAHLREAGYHPRSSAHGKALCEYVLRDLLRSCPKIASDAATGKLVYDVQRKLIVGGSEWNIDLVLGPPGASVEARPGPAGIQQAPPATIRIAVEAKTVMTEHGKARRNRQRDLVEETLALLRALPMRASVVEGGGLEANGAIVIEHDNVNLGRTRLVSRPPAPQVGDPLHYDSFIVRICDRYSQRFG